MDLADILFNKLSIHTTGSTTPTSGGGSGHDVSVDSIKTARIRLDMIDGQLTLIDGQFPDWCTEENSSDIYGRILVQNAVCGQNPIPNYLEFSINMLWHYYGSTLIVGTGLVSQTEAAIIAIATDLVGVKDAATFEDYTAGSFTLKLIYVPTSHIIF